MVAPDRLGEVLGPLAGFDARVLGAHVAGVEDPAAVFSGVDGDVEGLFGEAGDSAGVFDDLDVWRRQARGVAVSQGGGGGGGEG